MLIIRHRRPCAARAGLRVRDGLRHGRFHLLRVSRHDSAARWGLGFIIHKVGPIFTRVFHKYDALNESVEENVTGMRVVKSYVREDYEKQKFAHAAQDVCADFTRAEKLLAFNNPMMNLCVNGAFVLIIFLGVQAHHHEPGRAIRRRPALVHLHLRLPDSHEPHAALHDLRRRPWPRKAPIVSSRCFTTSPPSPIRTNPFIRSRTAPSTSTT